MANNKESTAVNELISLAQAGYQRVQSDEDDLMFRPPTTKQPSMNQTLRAPMAPLPRRPSGTASQAAVPAIPAIPAAGSVRISTAPTSRTASIPPLPQQVLNPRQTMPATPPPPTRAPLPPPTRKLDGTPAPELFTRNGPAITMSGPLMSRPPAPAQMPVAAPFEPPPAPTPVMPLPAPPQSGEQPAQKVEGSWFETSSLVDKMDASYSGTTPVEKYDQFELSSPVADAKPPLWKKLIVPAAGAVALIAFFAIGYAAFDGEAPNHAAVAKADAKRDTAKPAAIIAKASAPVVERKAPAPAPAADPAATDTTKPAEPPKAEPPPPVEPPKAAEPPKAEPPKAEPAVAKAEEPKPVAPVPTPVATNLVDVRFDSAPAGATVMLVDHGKNTFLGTTPISAAIDPSRKYDVVFTLDNHPTVLQHLDPKSTHHMAVALAPAPATPVAQQPVTQPAVAEHHHHHHDQPAQPAVAKVETPKVETPVEQPKPVEKVAKPAPKTEEAPKGDMGTLMVSSKPPCQIVIDGSPTGLTTPQRAIPLPPGTHKVTFVNTAENINKTVTINVTAGTPTKLIQNLMQ